ncbi:MAG: Extracellular serine protease precursor [Pedosphaera sp.]|nr:Extracellular serine protease precursor [Pedosphaera sp.]
MKIQPLLKSIVLGALITLNLSAQSASVTWSTPVTIAGASDVSTTGTLAYAYCWSGTSTTVNGVNFTGTTSASGGGTDVTLTNLANNYTSFGSGPGVSAAYQNMLTGGDYNSAATATVTLNHLTFGHGYVAQFWVGDWRNINTVRNETIKGSASDNITPALAFQVGSSGSGTYVIGSFTASATTQTFTLTPGGSSPSAQINALQLRDLTPPASSIWTNTSGGSWSATVNWSNSVAANGVGAAAGFNTLTLTANAIVTLDGARTIGNLFFDDRNITKHSWLLSPGSGDPLTLATSNGAPVISNNVSTTISAVLAGTNGLTKNGSGRLTLSAINTYSGGTTIGTGTLQLGDGTTSNGSVSGAIVNNGSLVVANPTAQTFANTITGNGGFTKTGAGTLTLSRSNVYHGTTTISVGTVRLLPTQLPAGLQIMPLGDSITYGGSGSYSGYRGFLYSLLNPVAINFQFVGASAVNPSTLPTTPVDETHHNGYSSYATLDLLNNLDGLDLARYNQYGGVERYPNGGYWLTGGNGTGRSAVYPDFILLLVGANDISQATLGNTQINIVNYQSNLTALINKLTTLRPNARVITADITPWPGQSASVTTINNMVHTVVTNFQAQGARVSEVDLNTQFPADGISGDGLHPNDTGYNFMAGQWYDSILSAATGVSSCIPGDSTVAIATNATLDLNGNQASIGGLTGLGNVVLGNGGMLTVNASNSTVSTFAGVISGNGALTKTGGGSLILTGTNLYTGATTVSGGALLIQGNLAGTSSVTIANGILGGNGTVSGTVAINGVIAPGTSGVGTLSTGSNNWNSGGIFMCEINGTNATDSDQVAIAGSLIVQATSGSPFTVKLVSLTGGNAPGPVPNFSRFSAYAWTIASSSSGVQNFATNKFVLDTSSFSNDFSGGNFSLASDGSSLLVHYTPVVVPPTWGNCGPWSDGSFPLVFSGPSGQTYKVLTSTDVSLPMAGWTQLTNGTFGDGPANFTDSAATNGTRFYRIVSP